MGGMTDWWRTQGRSGGYYSQEEPEYQPITKSDLESFLKQKEKEDTKTAEEESASKAKRRGALFSNLQQQIFSGQLSGAEAAGMFSESAKGYGGLAVRQRGAQKLAGMQAIPGYDPQSYKKFQQVKSEQKEALEGVKKPGKREEIKASFSGLLDKYDPATRYGKGVTSTYQDVATTLGLPKGTLGEKQVSALSDLAAAQNISESELPSWMQTQLESSQVARPYLLKEPQEQLEFTYGTIGRDETGKLSNTYQSVLTGNLGIASSYGLKPGQGMSISDIEHLKGIDMQNVVNAGLTKVENIRATSNLMNLIGYALG